MSDDAILRFVINVGALDPVSPAGRARLLLALDTTPELLDVHVYGERHFDTDPRNFLVEGSMTCAYLPPGVHRTAAPTRALYARLRAAPDLGPADLTCTWYAEEDVEALTEYDGVVPDGEEHANVYEDDDA